MKKRSETKRQLFHMFFGIFLVILLMYGFVDEQILFFLIVLGIIVSFASKKHKIPIIYWFLERFEREKDLGTFPGKGVIFYLIGVFLVVSFFSLEIALPAILILALGDSVSNMLGVRFGRVNHPFTDKKTLEGLLSGFFAGFLGALYFLPWPEAIMASSFAMLAEGIELKVGLEPVDDNIIIPLVAAISVSLFRYLI
ncbi:hypothetical protein ISS07_02865 [Candidatus Woesearchaeota archaeon]|nr:hypothetical protein [Candidatus Woesearchaeota archaeon]